MKKIFLTALAGILLAGCADKKVDKKAIMDTVMSVHEKVMGAEGIADSNKTVLDSLVKQGKLADKDSAVMLSKKLGDADSAMTTWMHKFDPDFKGKTEDETVAYLNAQKKQIMTVDSQLKIAIDQSSKYLAKTKKK